VENRRRIYYEIGHPPVILSTTAFSIFGSLLRVLDLSILHLRIYLLRLRRLIRHHDEGCQCIRDASLKRLYYYLILKSSMILQISWGSSAILLDITSYLLYSIWCDCCWVIDVVNLKMS
jgi:hypothetical protein